MVKIQQLMNSAIVVLPPETSVAEAAAVMNTEEIGSVLVGQRDRIIGIVTETDIVRKVVSQSRQPLFVALDSIMTSPVIGIEGCRSITEAADLMQQHRTRHLAVLRDGVTVGVVSVRDLLEPVSVDEF